MLLWLAVSPGLALLGALVTLGGVPIALGLGAARRWSGLSTTGGRMKHPAATLVSLLILIGSSSLHAEQKPMLDDGRSVAPALENYTKSRLLDEVWKRPGLSPRDRSIVTLASERMQATILAAALAVLLVPARLRASATQ